MKRDDFTQSQLKELLSYDQETGEFTWLRNTGVRKLIGKKAGCTAPNGYLRIRIMRVGFMAHRLAWLYMTGGWPIGMIDHINCNRADNRWANLRQADKYQNGANQGLRKSNTTGLKGVSVVNRNGKFQAGIRTQGKKFYLGQFDTPEEAHEVFCKAAKAHHKEFFNQGRA